jgi:lysine 2,3-aminomutase
MTRTNGRAVKKSADRRKLFKDVSDEEWYDWKWQMRNQLRSVDDVVRVLNPNEEIVEGIRAATKHFRQAITPYYASLIDFSNVHCPIWQQAIPASDEAETAEGDLEDPLAEDRDSPVPGLTHRYPDRVLLLVTDICSMYCRHCTRRRLVGHKDTHFDDNRLQKAFDYIAKHKEVREIVVSGGDPLTLSDARIEKIVKSLRAIPHVEIIRIGTRMPVVLPMRITPSLVSALKKHHPVFIATHFNHAKEMTADASKACATLADGGFPVYNQSVLLRGVNDCPHVMKELVQKLVANRVRPYYIFQCDLSKGIAHFRTSLGKGVEIIEALRGHTSGMSIPTYVVDLPGGGGKTPLMPSYLISRSDDRAVIRNYEGLMTTYLEPKRWDSICGHDSACKDEKFWSKKGPAMLLRNPDIALVPQKEMLEPDKKKATPEAAQKTAQKTAKKAKAAKRKTKKKK